MEANCQYNSYLNILEIHKHTVYIAFIYNMYSWLSKTTDMLMHTYIASSIPKHDEFPKNFGIMYLKLHETWIDV